MTGVGATTGPLPAGARVALVVNPVSRRGHDRETVDAVARTLGERYAVDIVVPPSAADVERAVRVSTTAHDAVVVAGGDGTIHRAVCGLDGAPTPQTVVHSPSMKTLSYTGLVREGRQANPRSSA